MNFYWSYAIALQKLSNDRSYKLSWILEVISIIIFHVALVFQFDIQDRLPIRNHLIKILFYIIHYFTRAQVFHIWHFRNLHLNARPAMISISNVLTWPSFRIYN